MSSNTQELVFVSCWVESVNLIHGFDVVRGDSHFCAVQGLLGPFLRWTLFCVLRFCLSILPTLNYRKHQLALSLKRFEEMNMYHLEVCCWKFFKTKLQEYLMFDVWKGMVCKTKMTFSQNDVMHGKEIPSHKAAVKNDFYLYIRKCHKCQISLISKLEIQIQYWDSS